MRETGRKSERKRGLGRKSKGKKKSERKRLTEGEKVGILEDVLRASQRQVSAKEALTKVLTSETRSSKIV